MKKRTDEKRYYFRVLMPSIIFLLITILALGQWNSARKRRRDMYRIRMERQASRVCFFIEKDLEDRIKALERIASRWETLEDPMQTRFSHFTADLFEDKPGFQAVKWVDPSYHIRWLLPLSGNEEDKDKDLNKEENLLKLLEISRNGKDSVITPLGNVDNGRGFRIIVPLFPGDQFDGFLMAKLQAAEWLNTLFHSGETSVFYNTIIIRVGMNGEAVYQTQAENSPHEDYGAEKKFSFRNHNFSITCVPREDFFQDEEKDQSLLLLILGLLHAFTLGGIIFLLQNSSIEKIKKMEARTALKEEVQTRHLTEEEMTELNTRLQLATEAGKIGIWSLDLNSKVLEWNDIMFELYGVPKDVIPSYKAWMGTIHPDDLPGVEEYIKDALEGRKKFDTVFRILVSGEPDRIMRAAATVKRDPAGKALHMTGTNWDISESKKTEEMLDIQRQRLENILEGTNVGTWEWNIKTGETVFNERWADIIGYKLRDISPVSIETWVKNTHPDDLKHSDELLQKHFRGELPYYECEVRMKHRDGHWVWVLDRGRITRRGADGEVLLMSGTHAEISERKINEEKVLHMAVHDALTDLPTLRLARDRLKMAVHTARRNSTRLAVLYIDLDRFKWVNDNYGHDIGDEVLIRISHILQNCIRESDTAARMGGDEFLVLLTEIHSPDNAGSMAEKLVDLISSPFMINGSGITISASIGIAMFPDNGEEPEVLIRKADHAMYRIKKTGKNGFFFA